VHAAVTSGALWAVASFGPSAPASSSPSGEGVDAYRTVVDPAASSDGLDAQREIDARSPGFATSIDPQAHGGPPGDAMAVMLSRAPGATVRSIGGLGQFAAVSLRGSAAQQVPIFLDGVPITGSLAGLVDLSVLPVDGLGRIDIYRGHVPVEFGAAAMGGAIDLSSAAPTGTGRVGFGGGVGSFGARSSRAGVTMPLPRNVGFGAVAAYDGATGDFPYFDDGGTPTLTGDDTTLRRSNDDYDRLLAQVRVHHRRGDWTLAGGQLVTAKRQGIPGRVGMHAERARLHTVNARTTFRARKAPFGDPRGRLEWVLGLGAQDQRFRDPAGEVGIGIDDEHSVGLETYVSPRIRVRLWRGAWLGLVADQRTEWIAVRERASTIGTTGDARRGRLWFGTGAELEQFLFDRRWLLVPSVRVDAIASRFAVPLGTGEQDDEGTDDLAAGVSPRLATRVTALAGVSLRATVGRAFRPPNLSELFGDRGYIVGNEGLRPERSLSVDGGVVLDRRVGAATLYAQAAGFGVWADDLIQWVAAGPVTRPINVEGARLSGLELSGMFVPDRRFVTLDANYTLLHSENLGPDPAVRGQPLPGRPRHELYVHGSSGGRVLVGGISLEPRVSYTVEVIAGTRLDTSGRLELPARAIQGVGAELHVADRVHLSAEVRNLLDVRTAVVTLPVAGARPTLMPISDFLGFPLPGRSVWVALSIDLAIPRRRQVAS
jgi:vitamin B12 transporter